MIEQSESSPPGLFPAIDQICQAIAYQSIGSGVMSRSDVISDRDHRSESVNKNAKLLQKANDFMSIAEQKCMIHFLEIKGSKAKQIHAELISVYRCGAIASMIVKKRRQCFLDGMTNMQDLPRSGMPSKSGLAKPI
jgi:hypothetical protein